MAARSMLGGLVSSCPFLSLSLSLSYTHAARHAPCTVHPSSVDKFWGVFCVLYFYLFFGRGRGGEGGTRLAERGDHGKPPPTLRSILKISISVISFFRPAGTRPIA